MNELLDLKLRENKGKKLMPYFIKLLNKIGIKDDDIEVLNLAAGDEIRKKTRFETQIVRLVNISDYKSIASVNELFENLVLSEYSYFFCDYFELIGPCLLPTKLIFDNLIQILLNTNEKTALIIDKNLESRFLINLLEKEQLIDIKMNMLL